MLAVCRHARIVAMRRWIELERTELQSKLRGENQMKFSWFLILSAVASLQACSPRASTPSSNAEPSASNPSPKEEQISRTDSAWSKVFCETNSPKGSLAYGRWIEVPLKTGGISHLYTWTLRPFDASKPTMIFVDGGPGLTSHGRPTLTSSDWNQLHFDPRGVGCSGFSQPADSTRASSYGSEATVTDLLAIQKAYQLRQVSFYAVSYGTLPATVFATRFPHAVRSLVLEGTVYRSALLHSATHRATLYNQVLAELTPEQQSRFTQLIVSQEGRPALSEIWSSLGYRNNEKKLTLQLLNFLVDPSGSVNQSAIANLAEDAKRRESSSLPQAVQMWREVVYCQELGREFLQNNVHFQASSATSGKFVAAGSKTKLAWSFQLPYLYVDCKTVPARRVTTFPSAFKQTLSVPTFYVQGEQDLATSAESAIEHRARLKPVRNQIWFAKEGGHQPLLELASQQSPFAQEMLESLLSGAGVSDHQDLPELFR